MRQNQKKREKTYREKTKKKKKIKKEGRTKLKEEYKKK